MNQADHGHALTYISLN